jgi:hypothetical protein
VATSFQKDIAPMLAPFRANMMWRFDITSYETVKANVKLIAGQILTQPGNPPTPPSMPPEPYAPLTDQQQALFTEWMKENCPP